MNRRELLLGGGAFFAGYCARAEHESSSDVIGRRLTPWRRGGLDLHHIATGQGDCTLIIYPDGTSLMMDAGATASTPPEALAMKPNGRRRAGEWMGRYALRHLKATGRAALDYLLVSHLHPDHVGDVTERSPPARDGAYRLTGVSDVAALLPVAVIVDRGYPGYDYPAPWKAPFALNYQAFIRARVAAGGKVERFRVGSRDQFGLRRDAPAFPGFSVRNLAANGEVAAGNGEAVRSLFPRLETLAEADVPDENACSTAIAVRYGNFGYFAAGDLTSNTFDGTLPWRDVLTQAAEAAGPVDVAVAPHHGMFDASSPGAVKALRPKIWIISSWHVAHPSTIALERMFSPRLYAGPRDALATGLAPANDLVNGRLTARLLSKSGHVVVRVAPGGDSFRVVVTDNSDERDRVKWVLGPYKSGT